MRSLWTCMLLVMLAGCSADFAERQADRAVRDLIKDRERKALGYEPQAEAKVEPTDRHVASAAYTAIPQTPIPQPGPAQVEPLHVELEYGVLGPRQVYWPEGGPAAPQRGSDPALDERIRQRLTFGPLSPTQRRMKLDFFEALKYGVEHSRAYQDQMEDLYVSALNVTLQRHLFEPRPFAGGSLEFSGGQKDASYKSALASTVRAGVRQKLPYGGEVVAQGLVTFVDALNKNSTSGEDAAMVLSASVPLLRGAGMVNLEPLINSERQLVYEVRRFENFRRDFVISVAQQYFRLLNLQQSVIDRRLNYVTYELLTERARAMYAAAIRGFTFLELQRSRQELLSAENDVIDATENLTSALDDFKLLIGMPTDQEIEIVPVELAVNLPELDEQQAVATALKYRLDVQTARDKVEDARRAVANAKNGLLPDLDLTVEGRIGNRDRTPAGAIDERTQTYSARLELDLPVDRVAERNVYRRALIEVRRSERALELLRDVVSSDVRESMRLLRQAKISLDIQREGIELAQRRRDNAYDLLKSGKSTSTRDLVEAQSSLLRARDRYENARATYQIQVLRLLRNCGTLRVDPAAGAIGHAMERLGTDVNGSALRQ